MRAVLGLLLLLLGLCGSRGAETTKPLTKDIWEEVRALRDTVVELTVLLELLQKDNADLQTRLSKSESELNLGKSRIDQLEKDNSVQATELESLETGLTATESKTSDLEKENTDMRTRLSSSESEILLSKSRIDQLEKENAGKPKVAFYTALTNTGLVGPYNVDITLKYSKVFTNIGNAYNPTTGFFTAPVEGVYYLQFTVCGNQYGHMGVWVYKNNQRIMYTAEWNKNTGREYVTNSVIVQLRAGDHIHLDLPSGYTVYDDGYNHSTFSGSLLYPL
ncbi:heavy metal-binding protein HIP-like [Pempheris klunzingeri]|uniref:heavy metal-binding protein HIP-like n=1 Tax=Pempheris klunzingeri TaxID=3127111 RepID=UPI00397EC2A5